MEEKVGFMDNGSVIIMRIDVSKAITPPSLFGILRRIA